MKYINKYKKLIIIIMAFFSTSVFFLNLNLVPDKYLSSNVSLFRFFEKIFRSIKHHDILSLPIFISAYFFYNKYYFKSKINKPALIVSILVSISQVLGYSYSTYNSWKVIFKDFFQFFKSTSYIIGLVFILYILIKKIYDSLGNVKDRTIKSIRLKRIYNFIFEEHPFIMPMVIMLVCWLPYIVFYFPGCSTGTDTRNQIYMYYGIDSFLTQSVVPLKEGVYLNNLHPLLHSLFTGACLDLGFFLFKSYTAGLFIYTLVQTILTLLTLSYTIVWMKKINAPNWIRILSLVLYCFLSFFPYFAITHGKDTPFSLLMVLFVIKVFDLINDSSVINNKKYMISFSFILLALLFLRNDGIYRIIISFIFIILVNKTIWKKLLLIAFIPVSIYLVYLHFLLPMFSIPSENSREMLSVPFQQTARVVYFHSTNAYKKEDIEKIKKVLPSYYDMKKLYNPQLSDPVKNTYNMYATKEELIDYFKVWFKYLFRYPTDYIEATLNNTYGYFYIDLYKERGFGYTSLLELDDGIFNIKYIDKFKNFRNALNLINRTLKRTPIIYLLYSVGFYDWFLIIMSGYFFMRGKKKYIITLIPLYSVLLINLLSPVNGHFRYTLPIIFSFPVLVCIFCYENKKKVGNK